MKKPTLSIVILCYNEEKFIGRCLKSAINQTERADEIIIVDNNSTDDSVKIINRIKKENPESNIRLLFEKQQGIIPVRNKGFNSAKSEIIGRIDADSTLEKDWVKVVKEIFTDKTVAAATGPVIYNDMPMKKIGLYGDNAVRKLLASISEHKFLFGSNMAIRATAWNKVKDKAYFALAHEYICHEDIDLALCLKKDSLKIVYAEKMVGGASARRIENSPKEFAAYNQKYINAYKRHNIKCFRSSKLPVAGLWTVYFPVKFMRFAYKKTRRECEE